MHSTYPASFILYLVLKLSFFTFFFPFGVTAKCKTTMVMMITSDFIPDCKIKRGRNQCILVKTCKNAFKDYISQTLQGKSP